jgi:hypothetical protein
VHACRYDRERDAVLACQAVSYGPHRWPLPLHSSPLADAPSAAAVFAAALLDGRVLRALKGLKEHLVMPPASFAKPQARSQVRPSERGCCAVLEESCERCCVCERGCCAVLEESCERCCECERVLCSPGR